MLYLWLLHPAPSRVYAQVLLRVPPVVLLEERALLQQAVCAELRSSFSHMSYTFAFGGFLEILLTSLYAVVFRVL